MDVGSFPMLTSFKKLYYFIPGFVESNAKFNYATQLNCFVIIRIYSVEALI